MKTEEIKMGCWIREEGKFPRCSNCNYYWIEQVVGPVGKGVSNLKDANYCPKCGVKMNE